MLWILVILSPIAFVSYILPITRRGQSLLSWRKWWEQLVAWSIIGIIAGFFLYLGFMIIAIINSNPAYFTCRPGDPKCGSGGLGLMNNVVPYLIPLVLLWVAYKETKRTTAMFAGDIIQFTEKIGKTAVTAGAMIATAGASMAVKAAGAAGGRIKGATGTMASEEKWGDWKREHKVVGGIMNRPARAMQWAERRKEGTEKKVEKFKEGARKKITEPLQKKVEKFKKEHPEFTGYAGAAKKGLKTAILGRGEKEEEGRPLTKDEKRDRVRYEEKTVKEKKQKTLDRYQKEVGGKITLPNGEEHELTDQERAKGIVEYEEEAKKWVKTDQKLTQKEIDRGHLINTTMVKKPGIIPEFKKAMKTIDEGLNEAIKEEVEKRLSVISLDLSRELDKIKSLQGKIERGETISFEDDIKGLKGGVEEEYRKFRNDADTAASELDEAIKTKIRQYRQSLDKRVEEETKKGGITIPKISDLLSKIHRKEPEKKEEEEKKKGEEKKKPEKKPKSEPRPGERKRET